MSSENKVLLLFEAVFHFLDLLCCLQLLMLNKSDKNGHPFLKEKTFRLTLLKTFPVCFL